MRELLDGAVEHAHAMGATALEGYPVDPGSERIDQTSGYVGTVQLFEAHRFRRVRQTAGRRGGKPRWLVRRELPLPRPFPAPRLRCGARAWRAARKLAACPAVNQPHSAASFRFEVRRVCVQDDDYGV